METVTRHGPKPGSGYAAGWSTNSCGASPNGLRWCSCSWTPQNCVHPGRGQSRTAQIPHDPCDSARRGRRRRTPRSRYRCVGGPSSKWHTVRSTCRPCGPFAPLFAREQRARISQVGSSPVAQRFRFCVGHVFARGYPPSSSAAPNPDPRRQYIVSEPGRLRHRNIDDHHQLQGLDRSSPLLRGADFLSAL